MRLRQMGFCFLPLQSLLPDAHLIVVSPVIGEKSCWMVTVSLEKNICLKCQVWQQSLPAYLDEERCFTFKAAGDGAISLSADVLQNIQGVTITIFKNTLTTSLSVPL